MIGVHGSFTSMKGNPRYMYFLLVFSQDEKKVIYASMITIVDEG